MVVSPWYLNLWFWTMVPRQKCVYVGELTFGPWWLVLDIIEPHVFGPLVLVIYGIDPWFSEEACLYKAKEITWLIHSCKLNILRSEILGYCFKSLIYESEVESESVKGDLSSAAAAEVRRCHRRRSAETPQKAQCGGATEGAVRRHC